MNVRYENWKECLLAVGDKYSRDILRAAKIAGCPGMAAHGYRIDWTLAQPFIDSQYDRFKSGHQNTLDDLRKEKLIADIENVRLTNKKLQNQYLDPEEVKQMLVSLATAQSMVLKRVRDELPPRVAGKSEPDCKVEIDKSFAEIFSVLQDKLDNWK